MGSPTGNSNTHIDRQFGVRIGQRLINKTASRPYTIANGKELLDANFWIENHASLSSQEALTPLRKAGLQRMACDLRPLSQKSTPRVGLLPRPIGLTGLDPAATCHLDLLNGASVPKLSRGAPEIKNSTLTQSGAYLMNHGVNLPWAFPASIWVLLGERGVV